MRVFLFIVFYRLSLDRFLIDKLGPMNVMIPFTALAGVMTYAWPFAQTEASLIVVTVLYGFVFYFINVGSHSSSSEMFYRFCSGSYVSLLGNPIMDMGDTEDVGRRLGMFMSILSIGALAGPPISGAISTATGGFKDVGLYAGSAHITDRHPWNLSLKYFCRNICSRWCWNDVRG